MIGSNMSSASSSRWGSPTISSWSGTSSATPASRTSWLGRAEGLPPAASLPTPSALPRSIRSSTGLIFERFLNPSRISMPDIDIDFADTGRDKVIKYVVDKYGDDRVAQIVTFGTLAAKASVRDIGKAMELPFRDIDRIAKLIPTGPGVTIDKAMEKVPEFKALYDS